MARIGKQYVIVVIDSSFLHGLFWLIVIVVLAIL